MSEELGKFKSLNFTIQHPSLDIIGYEFEADELFVPEIGDTQSLFRLDINQKTGEEIVYCAYSGDYDVMEEVTDQFDIPSLRMHIQQSIENFGVDNHGKEYVKYYELKEEGYDSEDAMDGTTEVDRAERIEPVKPFKKLNNVEALEDFLQVLKKVQPNWVITERDEMLLGMAINHVYLLRSSEKEAEERQWFKFTPDSGEGSGQSE